MINSKAIELLNTFSPEEVKEIGLFLRSPFFNSNKNLIKLFDVLKADRGKRDEVTEELLYGKLFPGKKYNYGIFKNLLSELYVQGCEYLAIKRMQSNKGDKNSYLIKELIERKLVKQADKAIKNTKDFFREKKMTVEDYHMDFVVEEYSAYSNYIRDKRWIENLSKKDDPLLMSKKFAVYFLMRFLNQYLFITHGQFSLKKEIYTEPLKKIINFLYDFLKTNLDYEIPNIEVLYHIVKMRIEPEDEKWYHLLKKKFFEYIDKVSIQIARNGLIYLKVYCWDRIEKGDNKFIKEYFMLGKLNIEKNLALTFGKIDPENFEEMTIVGLVLGETEYVEKFVNDYHHMLPETQWKEVYAYALALISFYKNRYDDALNYMSGIDPENFYTRTGIKELLLMIYYETGEWDGLYSLVSSYKAFLKKNPKLPTDKKKVRLNFVNRVYSLAKIKEQSKIYKNGLSIKLELLIKEFKNEPSISRVWLENKAKELLKSISGPVKKNKIEPGEVYN